MKISPINFSNTCFSSNKSNAITRQMVYEIKQKNPVIDKNNKILNTIATLGLTEAAIFAVLRKNGISYCSTDSDTVHAAAGYNGGYYSVKYNSNVQPEVLKAKFAQYILEGDNLKTGGILNYKDMVADIKRQDLIKQGLQLHTYELNTGVSKAQAEMVSKSLSKLSHKYIKPKDLFFIDNEGFYYDPIDKTAYGVNAYMQTMVQTNATFRSCKFNTDEQGNAIGYVSSARNIYHRRMVETSYNEQQQISEELPPIADRRNNKLYAEAFRFGNTKECSSKAKAAIPNVLDHLTKKLRINTPGAEQLQFVKLYDKDENILSRICFYDPTLGHSFVYNEEGKFLYEMEYNKDPSGNIVACSHY